jgi:hypothetical protein
MATPAENELLVATWTRKAREMGNRGADFIRDIRDRAIDTTADSVAITSQGFSDGGNHAGQIVMSPVEVAMLCELVLQELEGVKSAPVTHMGHNGRIFAT